MKKLIIFYFIILQLYASVITPIPVQTNYSQKAFLGKKLFLDTKLSKDNSVSCYSCHTIELGGANDTKYSFGIEGQIGKLNSPTILNSVYNFAQTRDGSAKNLKEQVHFPLTNPVEMGTSFEEVIPKLKNDKDYPKLFKENYADGINQANIIDAIVEFEKTLTTPNSKFDKYLRGDKKALTQEELDGYNLFQEYGCISCHNGVNIGSNLYQKVGIIKEYIDDDDDDSEHELGRYNVTKKVTDKHFGKVPTLRNIELTAPYLHDGDIKTLEEAVIFMLDYQVGMVPHKNELGKIVAFLKTLTGEMPKIMDIDNEK